MRRMCVESIGVCVFCGLLATTITRNSLAQTATLPSPWVSADIGATSPRGAATFAAPSFSISGTGADIWNTSDQFHFVYQQISGDVDMVARVDSLEPTDPWSKVGVMIRGSLSANAPNAYALLSAGHGLAFTWRSQAAAATSITAGPAAAAPQWVRIVRMGTTVTGYSSSDGTSWQSLGSAMVALGQAAYVGLAVTSHSPGAVAQAAVSQVVVSPLTLPTGQQTTDIGAPRVAGSTSYAQGVYTVTAAGADISGTSDQFRFVYQQVSGDVVVSARIESLRSVNSWSKAGVMIRETLDPGSRNAMALMSAGHGYSFQWRLDTGGLTADMLGADDQAPAWVRLVRTASRIEAFASANGSSWTSMGAEVVPMAESVYVGLAVTSHNTRRATTAVIDQLTVTQNAPSPIQPPTVALTAPASGSQFTAPASIVVSATASDPQNQLSLVEFYANTTTRIASLTTAPFTTTWTAVPAGTYSLTAVATDAGGASTTSAPVTITVTAAPSAEPRYVEFDASADNATLVNSYRLDVFSNGSDPNTATPIASANLGKPTPDATGNITVDEMAFFNALAPATYVATVSAIGTGGIGRSAPVTFVR